MENHTENHVVESNRQPPVREPHVRLAVPEQSPAPEANPEHQVEGTTLKRELARPSKEGIRTSLFDFAATKDPSQTAKVLGPLERAFRALDADGDNAVEVDDLREALKRAGFEEHHRDPRLKDVFEALKGKSTITLEDFQKMCDTSSAVLLYNALSGKLVIPDFEGVKDDFTDKIAKLVEHAGNDNPKIQNAQYIPELKDVDDGFGISICTVDGQRFDYGDCNRMFSIQSTSKPITYLIAQKIFGKDFVRNHVGVEPSGRKFNDPSLNEEDAQFTEDREANYRFVDRLSTIEESPDKHSSDFYKRAYGSEVEGLPHNPCINAGAIMAASMVYPEVVFEGRIYLITESREDKEKRSFMIHIESTDPDAPVDRRWVRLNDVRPTGLN